MPGAARVGDKHYCNKSEPVQHTGGEVMDPGCATVFIGDRNVARVGDKAFCDGGAHDVIVTGEPTVEVGGKPAARIGDATDGGHITTGAMTVLIGGDPRVEVFREAARYGLPFCERRARVRVSQSGQED